MHVNLCDKNEFVIMSNLIVICVMCLDNFFLLDLFALCDVNVLLCCAVANVDALGL